MSQQVQATRTAWNGRLRRRVIDSAAGMSAHGLLQVLAAQYRFRPALRKRLRGPHGWINVAVALCTADGATEAAIRFMDGKVQLGHRADFAVDATLVYKDPSTLLESLSMPPNETLLLLLQNRLRIEGNLHQASLFFYLAAQLMGPRYRRQLRHQAQQDREDAQTLLSGQAADSTKPASGALEKIACTAAAGVQYLPDPYLSAYSLADFPRLQRKLDLHHELRPEVCVERPRLLTRYFRETGFETDPDGRHRDPVLRQGQALAYLMQQRAPHINDDALLAGTTTSKRTGVVLYPDAHAGLLWGELDLLGDRLLNKYNISQTEIDELHFDILPFWRSRNFTQWTRETYGNPLCQQIDERFAVYFAWKSVALSHTVADLPTMMRTGAAAMRQSLQQRLDRSANTDSTARNTLLAMQHSLSGLEAYADNLAQHAATLAASEQDARRKRELARMAEACCRVPRHGARNLFEAVQSLWIGWIGLHMENTNAGLSIGRLDQWLQPYFAADMEALPAGPARQQYIKDAVELVGDLYLRMTDHLPTVPDIGNYLFGGSSSDQAITLGGVTRDGENAVNDMTYILLLVTEMLRLRDPNVNARYHACKNDKTYLRRLCEVNLITAATPSIHGDEGVMAALKPHGYPIEDIRDWSAIGCVEPTLSGKHIGHTGSLMFNMVAAVEMTAFDGYHPLMDWDLGPTTGMQFASFEDFFVAFASQLDFLVEQATRYNNMLAVAHQHLRPTPLLSSMIDGCADKGLDVTYGGATYNTSGVACIGLSDVVDSLMTIKSLVFDKHVYTLDQLRSAMRTDFADDAAMLARIQNEVPKFGSGDPTVLDMANRVTRLVHTQFAERTNVRGGPYTTGFWSMSNHVAFGKLTGALPSGRRAAKAFTPGLTPTPGASKNLLDNLCDVAALDPATMDNNIAFNVKYVPSAEDSHADNVEHMCGYVAGYVHQGGLQVQLNVVSSAVLRDAMLHPENYRDLLVRISGYNAYFVTLNRDMQIELIERAEFAGG